MRSSNCKCKILAVILIWIALIDQALNPEDGKEKTMQVKKVQKMKVLGVMLVRPGKHGDGGDA